MSNAPVDAGNVPVFTGQLSVLDEKVKALSADGGALANAGSSVHTTFGGMSAYYQAPEAEQLFAVTKPVVDITLSFSGDMCTIAGALGTYSQEIRPLVKQLEELKAEAASFQSKVSNDEDWIEDGDLIDENLDRRNKIAEVWTQFQAAERHAHDKIVALVCGAPLKVNDGSNGEGMYGYDAEALKQAKSLPWGDAVEESVPAWQVWEHAYDFGKGVIVDGVWGTLKGLGTLVGFSGWDAAGQAWTGLGKLATGLAITSTPMAAAFWMADDKDLPPWIRDSRTAMKETGKALIAWDQWGSNPSRAAGAVTFNVVTTVFTGGAGGAAAGAGKAGLAAKAISLAGKAGRAIDPMTYVFKGAGVGVSKIGDVMAGLKGLGKVEVPKIDEGAFSLPEGAMELPDGTIQLPKDTPIPEGAIKVSDDTIRLPGGTTSLPPGTVKLPFDGPAKYADEAGNLYKEDGSLYQKADEARPEPSPKPDTNANTPRTEAPVRQEAPVLAGVGARGGDDVIRVGSDISDPVRVSDSAPGRAGDNIPGGTANHLPGGTAGDNMPTNNLDNNPGGRAGDNAPGGGNPGDHTPAGRTETPPTSPATGHDLPGSSTTDNGSGDSGGGGSHRDGMSDEEILREQVDKANNDPQWRKEHYRKNGRRLSVEGKDEFGNDLPQLRATGDPNRPWTADELPLKRATHHPGEVIGKPATVDPAHRSLMSDSAAKRRLAIDLDMAAEKKKQAAQATYDADKSPENKSALDTSVQEYKKTHTAARDAAEDLGENAAEFHAIPDEFAGSTRLDDGSRGRFRFDQIWRTPEGRIVVVEAKASLTTELGTRDLGTGRKVEQGTREYFEATILKMEDRGEIDLAGELMDALDARTLDYVEIRANPAGDKYNGYEMKYFNIGKET